MDTKKFDRMLRNKRAYALRITKVQGKEKDEFSSWYMIYHKKAVNIYHDPNCRAVHFSTSFDVHNATKFRTPQEAKAIQKKMKNGISKIYRECETVIEPVKLNWGWCTLSKWELEEWNKKNDKSN